MLQRTLPAGFVAPCLPTKSDKLPSGSEWLHEIKHDGFRVIARKKGPQVRLYSRPGNDLTHRFPLIVETLGRQYEAAQKKRSRQPGRPPLVHGQRELLRAWAYSARFHTSSAFPPDEVRATPKVKSSPASLMIDHF
jgi:hypothetical protein